MGACIYFRQPVMGEIGCAIEIFNTRIMFNGSFNGSENLSDIPKWYFFT